MDTTLPFEYWVMLAGLATLIVLAILVAHEPRLKP